jgi:amidase
MIDHCGPMAASVRDVALLLSVLAGYDGIDPRMTPETPLRSNVKDYAAILDEMVSKRTSAGEWTLLLAGSGLKVGILKEGWEVPGLSSDVALVVKNAAERFTLVGAKVEEVSIPFHKEGPAIWTAVTRAMMADYATRNIPLPLLSHPLPHISPPPPTQEMYTKLSHHNPAVINVLFNSAYIRSEYGPEVTAKAVMHVHELRAAYDTALETYDILITPVTLTVAPKHPMESDGVMARINQAVGSTSNTCPFNVTGHPALSMPVGWGDAVDGNGRLPIGMQIIGKRWDEETILKAALMWEVGGLGLDNE